jgi:FMNH2-dependent dimethyl sulfone monooxygenase
MLNSIKGEREPSLEAWTTLTAIAAQTNRIELFHTTICQGFRYPAVLAKMAATLDDVSGGRFRFSIGSGWYQREFQAYGAPWYDHDTKIDIAREQVEIIKSLWTQPRFKDPIDYFVELPIVVRLDLKTCTLSFYSRGMLA